MRLHHQLAISSIQPADGTETIYNMCVVYLYLILSIRLSREDDIFANHLLLPSPASTFHKTEWTSINLNQFSFRTNRPGQSIHSGHEFIIEPNYIRFAHFPRNSSSISIKIERNEMNSMPRRFWGDVMWMWKRNAIFHMYRYRMGD